jgi:hypothetical protein
MTDSGILRRPHFLRMQSSSIRACAALLRTAFSTIRRFLQSDERRLRGMWAGKTSLGNSLRGPMFLCNKHAI